MNLSKNLSRRTLLIAALAGLVLVSAFILSFILQRPSQSVSSALSPVHRQERTPAGLPVRLKIPKINVDAAIDYVGITPQGALGVPSGPSNAAWYDLGPRPGESGDAVIDGHSGWVNNTPAVFDNLHALQKGDKLYVVDEKGLTATFVVRELRSYGPNENDSNVFRSSGGKAHLNLITCQGDWNQAQKSYSSRLVVFADEE
jgi:LPXTG-site transpeptidase (sortase) family protein